MRTPSKKAIARATALGNTANPANNAPEAERATAQAMLTAHCAKHGLTVTDYLPALIASPASGEAPAEAKPSASDIERERATANRAATMRHYRGPSQASHAARAPKLAEALARVAAPIQRAKSASERDESALALALVHADKAHTFCPVAGTFDLGVLSRLASLGHIAVSGERIALTKTGLALARNVAKRAA
jgi:hypothetical protein